MVKYKAISCRYINVRYFLMFISKCAGTKNANFRCATTFEIKKNKKKKSWIRMLKWMKHRHINDQTKWKEKWITKKKKVEEKNVFMIEVNSVCVPKDERKIYHALETLAVFFLPSSCEEWENTTLYQFQAILTKVIAKKRERRRVENISVFLLLVWILRKRFSTLR